MADDQHKSLDRALMYFEETRQEKLRSFFMNIPWNIFAERHGLLIPLFMVGMLVFLVSGIHLIFNINVWQEKVLVWNGGLFLLYIPFLMGVCFFQKVIAMVTGWTLLIVTFALTGFYPFNQSILVAAANFPVLGLLPLAPEPLHVVTIWQIVFNMVAAPITGLFVLSHRSLEIYFNPAMRNELKELLSAQE